MNAIIEHEETKCLPAVSTEKAMINQIAEMAKNPDIDPDRIEKLLNIQIKMMDRQAKIDYDQALADLQMEMPRITARGEIKNREGKVTSTYMKYEDIDRVLRPLMQKHGFSLMHDCKMEGALMMVTTMLKHRSGHQESVSIPLPFDKENALKSALQAAASTEAFGKRRNVCRIFNIVAEGEDNDGQLNHIKIDDSQAKTLKDALRDSGSDTQRFLQYMGVTTVENIAMKDYDKAFAVLQRKFKEFSKQAGA